MAAFKNYYQVLGIDPSANAEGIKSAFRKLARRHHPDLNGNNKQAEEKFKDINEAYEILSDPGKRAMHDASLQALQPNRGGKQGAKAPAPNGKSSQPPPKKPAEKPNEKNTQHANKANPADAKKRPEPEKQPKSGTTPINELFESFLKKSFSDQSKSEPEDGIFGARKTKPEPTRPEPNQSREKPQRGEDVVVKTAITPLEASEGVVKTVNVQHNEICRRCSGTGKVNGIVCNACQGEKITVRLKKIDVRIPAGVKHGSRVRVAKEGGRGLGGAENGDLFLQIELNYDPSLRIEGLDVHSDVQISITDAVLGNDLEVPTLNGSVRMTVPPGTQTGKIFRLKEQGVQSGVSKGDHFVTVIIVTPDNLSSREKELYQELARLRPHPLNRKPK